METRKVTAKKAKELLYDIETFVHMYNELQTGREIHFETKTGICKASIIDPMIYSIIIEGQMKRTIPNNFELFCKYVKHGAI